MPSTMTLASVIAANDGVEELLWLAGNTRPINKPRPNAWLFFKKAAEKLLREEPAALELVLGELRRVLEVKNA